MVPWQGQPLCLAIADTSNVLVGIFVAVIGMTDIVQVIFNNSFTLRCSITSNVFLKTAAPTKLMWLFLEGFLTYGRPQETT